MFLGVPLLFPAMLSMIPKAAVNATLIFIGIQSMLATSIFERVLLVFTETRYRPINKTYSRLRPDVTNLYTGIQIGLVVGCWACTGLVGIAFPFFVTSLVVFRWHVLPGWFSEEELKALDELEAEDKFEDCQPAASIFSARSSVLSTVGLQVVEDYQEDPEPGNDDHSFASSLNGVSPPSLDLKGAACESQPVQECSGSVCTRMISGPAFMDCSTPRE
eukprot:TRINITY_DN27648_c0_g1_i2.p1 TRINITY_DN27648_c0_g1~~TRINITY_DN27648_c0_g1_i2.p1  ORF type:complete len:218 (-),score=32.29 TRINITY_DN27648_c0_g1_i2:26-679(-)